ncbi:HU family DNA-binding protein [Vibrio parahaemolyticus]|uniref:HU family DNA-binding protein n=1 Tax=Vibrio parahaemolyticus TaxID=670 RepID=UPI0031CCB473
MNRSQLTEVIVSKLPDMPKNKVRHGVDTIFNVIKDGIKNGERMEIRGIGSMSVREYDERVGRNPKTGEKVHVGRSFRVRYRQSNFFNEALNKAV